MAKHLMTEFDLFNIVENLKLGEVVVLIDFKKFSKDLELTMRYDPNYKSTSLKEYLKTKLGSMLKRTVTITEQPDEYYGDLIDWVII